MEIDPIAERIRADFDACNAAREPALRHSRRAIQAASQAIRCVHRGEHERGDEFIEQVKSAVESARELLKDHPDIYWAGFLQDAEKEYVEACLTAVLVRGGELPGPSELDVPSAQYVLGLAEAVGEMRRSALDALRDADVERAERLLADMDEIYYLLISLDYPDAIAAGLRRATDVARSVTQATRSELSGAIRQRRLSECMSRLERRLPGEPAGGDRRPS